MQYGQGNNQHPTEFMQQQVAFPNVVPHHQHHMFSNSQLNNGYYGDPLTLIGSGGPPLPFNRRVLAGGIHMSQHSEAVGYFTANNAYHGQIQFGGTSQFVNPSYVPNTSLDHNTQPHMQNHHLHIPHPNFSMNNN